MKFISWNVNGLRAAMQKGWQESFERLDADVFCLQETKMRPEQLDLQLPGYDMYWNSAEKAGYSGTAVFSKVKPLCVRYGMGIDEHDHEGRLITLEFERFWLVCCYTPNAQDELKRIDYRMQWEDDLRSYLCGLDAVKPVIYCGDLNVAHEPIDLKIPAPTGARRAFLTRSGTSLPSCWKQDLPTPTAASIRTFRATAGGVTAPGPGPGTSAGASTISSSQSA